MAAATFRHLASRNLDPQLHTHAVIANMRRGRDGDWRSAEFTSVERSKLLIGAFYRNEFRTRLEGIGYATVPTLVGRMPGFEIAGYRTADAGRILDPAPRVVGLHGRPWLGEHARHGHSRRRSTHGGARPSRSGRSCMRRGRSGRRELGPARDRDIARGRNGVRASASPQSEPRAPPSALSVVRRAVEHLEERRTVFSANDLRAWALAHGGGQHSLAELDDGIGQLRRDGHLIEVTARRADTGLRHRPGAQCRARHHRRHACGLGRRTEPGTRRLGSRPGWRRPVLNPGQRDAARSILLSPHCTVGVQGHAGSGKTTMLRAVKELAGESQIVGLAPSASAVHVLSGEADIPARTLQGFLTRYRDVGDGIASPERTEEARKALGGAVLILDEASMVGTVQMRALTRIAA